MSGLIFLIGITVGCVATQFIFKRDIIGDLRIDRSDTIDGPYLFLELNKGLDSFSNKQYVFMRVRDENFNPRK